MGNMLPVHIYVFIVSILSHTLPGWCQRYNASGPLKCQQCTHNFTALTANRGLCPATPTPENIGFRFQRSCEAAGFVCITEFIYYVNPDKYPDYGYRMDCFPEGQCMGSFITRLNASAALNLQQGQSMLCFKCDDRDYYANKIFGYPCQTRRFEENLAVFLSKATDFARADGVLNSALQRTAAGSRVFLLFLVCSTLTFRTTKL
ncbi:uncharacterized protein LOC129602570 [Paramacrobiotus metropolitanus]|uniref:uncharacterized protein LOC129602570 n=1 Tax=Paramacrobiotus metropolitanus TaxID=2943436 RepID=UPI002445A1CD|nr:uncharacterized protein LOC129602570 [Paramacrobiotus metropolitanus]